MGIDKKIIITELKEKGLLRSDDIGFKPLEGGVSSNIYLITDGNEKFVVKQAREKLQVKDVWHADTARNQTEQDFISYLKTFSEKNVADILYSNQRNGFFVMEFLGKPYENWKSQLMRGDFNKIIAVKASELLAHIHTYSYKDKEAEEKFNSLKNFINLRIEPYLITTGDRHPILKDIFYNEAKRLKHCREALIHGDYSPKNIMAGSGNIVLLDHEAAWFGDPSFDVAFFLNHLYLKMLHHQKNFEALPELTLIAWNRYSKMMGVDKMESIEPRTCKLLLILMLARIDGKSPVEYLNESKKNFVRKFVYEMLPEKVYNMADIHTNWKYKLNLL